MAFQSRARCEWKCVDINGVRSHFSYVGPASVEPIVFEPVAFEPPAVARADWYPRWSPTPGNELIAHCVEADQQSTICSMA